MIILLSSRLADEVKKKESVRLIPLIFKKVVANPNVNKRPNTSHSNRYEVSIWHGAILPHILNKNECCPLSSHSENCHILLKGRAKNTSVMYDANCLTSQR